MRDAIQRMRLERRLALLFLAVLALAACAIQGVAAVHGTGAAPPAATELHP